MAKKVKKMPEAEQVKLFHSMNESDQKFFQMYLNAYNLAQDAYFCLTDEGKKKTNSIFEIIQRQSKREILANEVKGEDQ